LLATLLASAQRAYLNSYDEAPNPKPVDRASWAVVKPGVHLSFASTDIRYEKEKAPALRVMKEWKAKGWKGEKISGKLLIWTTRPLNRVNFRWSNLKNNSGAIIPADNVSVNFIRYVLTDSLGRDGMGCGIEPGLDSSLVEDVIDGVRDLDISANSTQPAWLSIRVPRNIPAGVYRGTVKVSSAGSYSESLEYTLEINDRVIPDPSEWKFHLDLWQNPFAVSRVHGFKNWSEKHLKALTPYMKMLASAGQKVITASIIYDPWNSQTFDVYESMVKWIKRKDGSWNYDYAIFDKWVSFMMSLGIDKEISCYSMIPWNLKFYYYDESIGKDTFIVAKPGTMEYEHHWHAMLADFAKHLKAKGWFEKTTIAMDERPMQDMQAALAIIKKADDNFRVSMAGEYHPEIEADLFDYCVASKYVLSQEVLKRRREKGFTTTFYTACPEAYPNTFTFSPPAESAFMGWYAVANGFDGYLRWAYNSWPERPLIDSRYGKWSAGDTYFVYPGPRASVRFERLIEGIQAYEKIKILLGEFAKNGSTAKLQQLKDKLADLEIGDIKTTGAAAIINSAQDMLNDY
jgi:hypothetical protein